MIKKSPQKDALVAFENADTVAKIVNWYYDYCPWIHPKLVTDKFIPHFIAQGKKIVNTEEKWKTRGEYEQFEFFQKKMEEHIGKTDLKAVAVNEYNQKQKAKGDDELSTIIQKMSLEPPSESMERKAKEIEYEISKIQTDIFDQKIYDVTKQGFEFGSQLIRTEPNSPADGFERILKVHKKNVEQEEEKGNEIVQKCIEIFVEDEKKK